MIRSSLLIALSSLLTGCTMFPATVDYGASPLAANSSAGIKAAAQLQPGSRVSITEQSGDSAKTELDGTVLQAGPQGVALMNCETHNHGMTPTPIVRQIPYVNRLFKATGTGRTQTPVQWVATREIKSVHVLAPPPPDYVAPQLGIDLNDEPVFERVGVDFDFNQNESFRATDSTVGVSHL